MEEKDKSFSKGAEFIKIVFQELGLPGLYGLLSRQKVINLLEKIYHDHGLYIGQVKLEADKEANYKTSKTCPYCQSPILNETEILYCKSCSSPYHKDCWLDNGQCAVIGCGQKEAVKNTHWRAHDSTMIDLSTEFFDEDYGLDQSNSSEAVVSSFRNHYQRIKEDSDLFNEHSIERRNMDQGIKWVVIVLLLLSFVGFISFLTSL